MKNADADVIRQVIEYLSKKGYTRTEAMLRAESGNQDADARLIKSKAEEDVGVNYGKAFGEKSSR